MVIFYTYLELYLADLHKRVSLSEFERHFKIPHQTIKARLKELVDAKILILEKGARFAFYSINKKNPLLVEYLAMCEKERMLDFLESNVLFRRLYDTLSRHMSESNILVFGSAAGKKGFEDIDLLIISGDKKIKSSINEFMQTYGVKIHFVQSDEKHLTDAFVTEIKKQHIVLNNHDYFVRRLYKNELGMV